MFKTISKKDWKIPFWQNYEVSRLDLESLTDHDAHFGGTLGIACSKQTDAACFCDVIYVVVLAEIHADDVINQKTSSVTHADCNCHIAKGMMHITVLWLKAGIMN